MRKEKSKDLAKKRLEKILIKDRALTRSSKVIAKAMIATGIFGMVSCSGVVQFASTEGIAAMGRANVGLIENGKASKNIKTAYWQNENILAKKRGLIDKLFSKKEGK